MRNIGILIGAIIGTGAATWIAAGGVSGSTREIDHKQVVEVVRPYSGRIAHQEQWEEIDTEESQPKDR
jgi:xanthine/uracil permease